MGAVAHLHMTTHTSTVVSMESNVTRLEPTPEGALIRHIREAVIPKLPVRAAAERAGMSAEQWGYIERGYRPSRNGEPPQPFSPPAATLARMARTLRISAKTLAEEGERPDAAALLDYSPAAELVMTARHARPFLPYEIPLEVGDSARLVLPVDMTAEEAERICGVIRSLAFPPEPTPA
jgi:hypothetical protein